MEVSPSVHTEVLCAHTVSADGLHTAGVVSAVEELLFAGTAHRAALAAAILAAQNRMKWTGWLTVSRLRTS